MGSEAEQKPTHIMRVSPAVFSEIKDKAAESWAESDWPMMDKFADWAQKTFACEPYHRYYVVVVWEWGTQRKWDFRLADAASRLSEGLK